MLILKPHYGFNRTMIHDNLIYVEITTEDEGGRVISETGSEILVVRCLSVIQLQSKMRTAK